MEVEPSIVVAFIALISSVLVAFLNRGKFDKGDAVRLENRLTAIETTLENKLEPIWETIMKELPKVLISPNAPRLDELLKKAMKNRAGMNNEELTELRETLKIAFHRAIETGDKTRALALSLYMSTFGVK